MFRYLFIFLLFLSGTLKAEPWIDTRDSWLRADIEYLADIGVVKVPVTTWPLMWAPILKDIEHTSLDALNPRDLKVLRRVKRKGKFETKLKSHSYLSLKAGNQGKILRHFGDDRREKAEVTSKTTGLTKNFAWNIEATRAYSPLDGEENRLDHSYIATIWGNWIFSAGAQERWWGPGWDSSLILSNNARPVPAISIQRNYSDPFESKWLSWIGPWTFNAFAGQLESDRHVPHAKLLGMSVNFKPFESLEIGLRRTAQWGGEGRPENASTFWNLLIGRDNCDELAGGCGEDRSNEPGNQLAGIDFKWHLPSKLGSIYVQLVGEDEAGYAPSRKVYQLGYQYHFFIGDSNFSAYLETADTENDFAPNITYNNGIYQTGYRTHGRSIGSSYDNDTESIVLGLVGNFGINKSIKSVFSRVKVNQDGVSGGHTFSSNSISFSNIELKYQYVTSYGLLEVGLDFKDKAIDTFNLQKERYNLAVSWTMEL